MRAPSGDTNYFLSIFIKFGKSSTPMGEVLGLLIVLFQLAARRPAVAEVP